MDLQQWVGTVRIFVIHINTYQRVPITEETPNNQEDRMIWPVDITLPLSLATPVLAPQAHEWSGPCDRDGGYA